MANLKTSGTNRVPGTENIQTRIMYYPAALGASDGLDDITYMMIYIYDRVNAAKLSGDTGVEFSQQRVGTAGSGRLADRNAELVTGKDLDITGQILTKAEEETAFVIDKDLQRLDVAIALPMPNQLLHPLRTRVSEYSAGVFSAVTTGAGAGADTNAVSGAAAGARQALKRFVTDDSIIGGAANDFIRQSGIVENPRRESFFDGVETRSFDFAYTLSPRNAAEAKTIMDILETLRFYMLPTFNNNLFYLVQPSEFKIKFMNGKNENTAVPKIDRCLLNNVTVNYSPRDRWVVVEGSGGFPPEIFVSLTFVEKQTMFREKVNKEDAFTGGF